MSERLSLLRFELPGIPVAQGATNPAQVGESYGRLVQWRNDIVVVARAARRGRWSPVAPPDCVSVFVTFHLPRSKSGRWATATYPGGPPDTDKLQRAVGDAMQTAGVYLDDAQIVDWTASKRFATAERRAGVEVIVFVVTGDGG